MYLQVLWTTSMTQLWRDSIFLMWMPGTWCSSQWEELPSYLHLRINSVKKTKIKKNFDVLIHSRIQPWSVSSLLSAQCKWFSGNTIFLLLYPLFPVLYGRLLTISFIRNSLLINRLYREPKTLGNRLGCYWKCHWFRWSHQSFGRCMDFRIIGLTTWWLQKTYSFSLFRISLRTFLFYLDFGG